MNLDKIVPATSESLTDHLAAVYSNQQIYHPLGKNGLVRVNPGRLVPADRQPQDSSLLHEKFNGFCLQRLSNEALGSVGKETYAVIVTGVSGAGKTTAMKEILSTLSSLGNSDDQAVINKMEQTMVIVDAMGNASTRNNHDSSRMIKSIRIQNLGADPSVTVSPMMLENTRLRYLRSPSRTVGLERSFHILYYLLAHGHPALDQDIMTQLYPDTVQLAQDAEGYARVDSAMKSVAGEQNQLSSITWDGLAAVVLLMSAEGFEDPRVQRALDLVENHTSKRSLPKGTIVWDDTGKREELERDELHVLAKNIYRALFMFWTGKADRVGNRGSGGRSVHFFDICGFEVLEENKLSQLLLNDFYEKVVDAQLQDIGDHNQAISERGQTCAHRIIERVARNDHGLTKGLEKILLDAKQYDKERVKVSGVGATLRLKLIHLMDSAVEYDHKSFVKDNEDIRRARFLPECTRLSLILSSTKTNDLSQHSASRSMLKNWKDTQAVLQQAHVLVINCIRGSRSLDPWTFDHKEVKAQLDNLAIAPTVDLLRSRQMEREETKANFASRYGGLLPPDVVAERDTLVTGGKERVARTLDLLILWLSNQDGQPWHESCVFGRNKIFYQDALTARLDALLQEKYRQSVSFTQPVDLELTASIRKMTVHQFHPRSETNAAICTTLNTGVTWYTSEQTAAGRPVSEVFHNVINPLVGYLGECDDPISNVLLQRILVSAIVSEGSLRLTSNTLGEASGIDLASWEQYEAELVLLLDRAQGVKDTSTTRSENLDQARESLAACLYNVTQGLLASQALDPLRSEEAKLKLFALVIRLSGA